MAKITEKELIEEFSKTLENPTQQNIVKKYLKKNSIEGVEEFIKELISNEVKEDET
jgi:hypothetical protein